MRLKILSVVICLISAFTLIIAVNIDSSEKTDSNNEAPKKSATSASLVLLNSDAEEKPDVAVSSEKGGKPDEIVERKEEETDVTSAEKTEIHSEPENTVKTVEKKTSGLIFSQKETDLLLRIGMCEAGCESVECIAHVMRTVLNRVEDDNFPNSIYDVLYQKGQFTPVGNGRIDRAQPSEKCYKALEMIKSGWNESQGALYFESCRGDSWHSRNLEYLFVCGRMRFYK